MTLLVPEMWTRSSSFARAHRVDVFDHALLILRDVTPGAWQIDGIPLYLRDPDTGATVVNACFTDLEEGGGIIAWYGSGTNRQVVFSGRVETVTEREELDDESGITRVVKDVAGVSDLAFAADRVAHPHPSDLDFTAAATKTYSGVGETQIKALVNDNMGSTAAASRKLANFATAADQARGASINDAVRLDPVGDLVAGWSIRAGVVPTMLPVAGVLTFDVKVGTDRSASLVFSQARTNVRQITRVMRSPELTFEWIGGQGVGTARTFRSAQDAGTASLWGFRREAFRDRRDTNDTTVLDAQGAADLQAKTANTAVAVEPLDAGQIVYGVDYSLGDTVTVVMRSGRTVVKAIREVRFELTYDLVCTVTPTISDPLTPGVDDLFVFNRVSNLEADLSSTQAAT